MANKYEQRHLIDFAYRVATRFSARSNVAIELSNWAEEQDLGFTWDPEIDHFRRKAIPSEIWSDLRNHLARQKAQGKRPKPDALFYNTSALASHIGLGKNEFDIFELAVRSARHGPIKSLCNSLTDDARLPVVEAVGCLLGITPGVVQKALAHSGRLLVSGLVQFEKPPLTGLGLQVFDRLLLALEPPSRGLEDILKKLFAPGAAASVAWQDFDHLSAHRDFAFRLLRGALQQREKGINILLHGRPGTGKTELCKLLADQLGANLHPVGEADDDGDEPSRLERLQQLRLGQRLLDKQGKSLILFDEMEDLFGGIDAGLFGLPSRRTGSKVHINRVLESNPVPTLWTTNDIRDCDPAFLRRISFTLELRTPPVTVRTRIWKTLSEQHRMPLPNDVCSELANSLDDAPALANSALSAARITGGGSDDVKLAATAISRAVRGGHTPLVAVNNVHFDPQLANADHDLDFITERFVAFGVRNTGGLCLSGAPGTGKSAFARFMADRLQIPVLERRASDLLDKYVGGSEQKIAEAFAEARDTEAFLIFDEADSLLGCRSTASHRWEISQVNEMLTWMESHPLPFACTTNMADRLDPATARRFALRVEFLPLNEAQRRSCFQRFFSVDPPEGLRWLDQLAPGDFAVVAKRIKLLGIREVEAILAELRREHASKPNTGNPMGFRVGG